MKSKNFKRINIWVDPSLYDQIRKKAEESYLKIATYTRQIIQKAMKDKNDICKNNSIKP
ncbi:MAG: hypothetical protein JXB49_29755 [Bacteroidales bacterium]|nr:hypothetical protein [Bacteroidales bacterium]